MREPSTGSGVLRLVVAVVFVVAFDGLFAGSVWKVTHQRLLPSPASSCFWQLERLFS